MSKHTPGPWYAVNFWVEHEDDKVADICTCNPEDFGQGRLGRTEEETRANARLIAAAPDLLRVLHDLHLAVTMRPSGHRSGLSQAERRALDRARAILTQLGA